MPTSTSSGAQVCRDFQRGVCTRGAACRFGHTGGEQPTNPYAAYTGATAYPSASGSEMQSPAAYGYGAAAYGATAAPAPSPYGAPPQANGAQDPYYAAHAAAHAAAAMGQDPYAAALQAMMRAAPPMAAAPAPYYNAAPEKCRDFLQGKCTRGSGCKFAHEENKVEQCRDYLKGMCTRDECKFSHDSIPVEECRDFKQGRCTRGDGCKFTHSDGGKRSRDDEDEDVETKRSKTE